MSPKETGEPPRHFWKLITQNAFKTNIEPLFWELEIVNVEYNNIKIIEYKILQTKILLMDERAERARDPLLRDNKQKCSLCVWVYDSSSDQALG